MSTTPELDLDLDKLFLPAWAQEAPGVNKFAGYAGGEQRESRDDERGGRRRPPRRDAPGGPPRRDTPGGPPRGQQQRGRPDGERGGRPPFRGNRPDARRDVRDRRPAAPEPLPQLAINILPEEKGMESLARQIRATGRAYPLFAIAKLVLQKDERYQFTLKTMQKPDGQLMQGLFLCALDNSLWLSEEDAVQHVLNRHFNTFYRAERTPTDPPRGTYTFVGQCGISGTVLGPPNYHDYQTQLRKLHTERFSRMPFEAFKARVRMVRDPEVVKKWIEDHSFKTEFECLNVPEPLKLANREELTRHFREKHLPNVIGPVGTYTIGGVEAKQCRCPGLQRLFRATWEEQMFHPLKLAMTLSQQFGGFGLQFFKVNRTVTHVCVARPRYLDLEATPVSEGVRRIVQFINTTPKCTRRKLLDALAPAPPPPPAAVASAPAADAATIPGPPTDATATSAPSAEAAPAPVQPAIVPATTRPVAPPAEPTAEQNAVASDIHWLILEGHVIEFANGILETAKKPAPKPPKPERAAPVPASTDAAVAGATETVPAAAEPAPTAEVTTTEISETVAEPPSPEAPGAEASDSEPPVAETPVAEAPPLSEASQQAPPTP